MEKLWANFESVAKFISAAGFYLFCPNSFFILHQLSRSWLQIPEKIHPKKS